MPTTSRLLLFFVQMALLASCGGSTMTPLSVSRAEPTKSFPQPWGGQASGAPAWASPGDQRLPAELLPREGTVQREQSLALVIGIEKYRRDLPNANGAASDARLFASFLQKNLGVPARNIHLLLDENATKSSIEAELVEWAARNAAGAGQFFFYFAGHGAPDPQSKGSYLMPWDADPKFVTVQGIAVDKLIERLDKLPAGQVLAFVDACFSGAGGRSVVAAGTRPVLLTKNPPPRPRSHLAMLTAAGPDEITGVGPTGNGIFSSTLFRGLNGAADANADHEVTLDELIAYTSNQVAEEARRQSRDQHPRAIGASAQWKKIVLTRFAVPGK